MNIIGLFKSVTRRIIYQDFNKLEFPHIIKDFDTTESLYLEYYSLINQHNHLRSLLEYVDDSSSKLEALCYDLKAVRCRMKQLKKELNIRGGNVDEIIEKWC